MKAIKLILIALIFSTSFYSCSSEPKATKSDEVIVKTTDIEVVYFHNERRCETCLAVEEVTREAIKEYYQNKISVKDYSLEDEKGEELANQLKVSGQALLILKGDKRIDLTTDAFMNARTNPDELKKLIKENIDVLL